MRFAAVVLLTFVLGFAAGRMHAVKSGAVRGRYELKMIGGTVPLRFDKERGTAEIVPITRANDDFDEIIPPPGK